jgi:hypothetical protein
MTIDCNSVVTKQTMWGQNDSFSFNSFENMEMDKNYLIFTGSNNSEWLQHQML